MKYVVLRVDELCQPAPKRFIRIEFASIHADPRERCPGIKAERYICAVGVIPRIDVAKAVPFDVKVESISFDEAEFRSRDVFVFEDVEPAMSLARSDIVRCVPLNDLSENIGPSADVEPQIVVVDARSPSLVVVHRALGE